MDLKEHDSKLPLPIGIDDYKKVIDGNCIYIDKTLLIKEFWEDKSEVILVTRPRRFGKTIALSMLRYFFERTEKSNAYLFESSKIWKEKDFVNLQGTYPVIYLSFKDIKGGSFKESYQQLKELLTREVHRTLTPIIHLLEPYYKQKYDSLIKQTANTAEFSNVILLISEAFEKHYGEKTIVLIDEYDTPITNAYNNKYYKKMINFMRDLFSTGLKSNSHLHRAFLTGVVRTAKDGILSGLNNPNVYTVLETPFSKHFGFLQEEVDGLLIQANLLPQKEDVKVWYNGYKIGDNYLYNPWSVLKFLSEGKFKTYWANTANNELLEKLVSEASEETEKELKLLLEAKPVKHKQINEDVILLDLSSKKAEPWSFLLFAGYLTSKESTFIDDIYYHTLTIPNNEVAILYKQLVFKAIHKGLSSSKLELLLKALLSGDLPKVNIYLGEFVKNMCSSHDLPENDLERSLHLFVLGLLASLSNRYVIKSNLESGEGRYDIMLYPKIAGDLGVLIECKKAPSIKQLETLAEEALTQIKTKQYEMLLRDFGYKGKILCYGIAAFKKNILTKMDSIK